ncbi:hypothetical protein [Actinopolyspora halophila]|uniref:hypothetical protein n=1 Tax=Actinopolyspora halophila TaxID=1850 RepID=UPI000372B79E|nr:hypothetical protein [Actinopolyspora halophila]
MGLSRVLLRFAASTPHAMVVEGPAGTVARLAVEDELRRRGWGNAASPADTDVLISTGRPGAESWNAVCSLWARVPEPRVFVHVAAPEGVAELLDGVVGGLSERGGQLRGAGLERGGGHGGPRPSEEHAGSADREGHGGHSDHSGHGEHGNHGDHGGHGGHGSHGGHGGNPAGLAMAERGPDRDGLALDRLHVPLGPALPHWPPGLIVRTTLQGDVVQEAEVELLDDTGEHEDFWTEPWRRAAAGQRVEHGVGARRVVAAHLDGLVRFLAVAGWPDPAARAARLREEVLAGTPGERVRGRLVRLIGRLRASRTLRWLTTDLGVLSREAAERAGFGASVVRASRSGGDVAARWREWLVEIEDGLARLDGTSELSGQDSPPGPARARAGPVLEVLPRLLRGVELSGARLIVASLDPQVAGLGSARPVEVSGG